MLQGKRIKVAIKNSEIKESSNGNLFVRIDFETLETGERVAWTGFLTEKAKPYCLRDLAKLGYKGTTEEDLAALQDGPLGILDLAKTYEVDVETEVNGERSYTKVSWIHSGQGADIKLTKNELLAKLKNPKSTVLQTKAVDEKKAEALPIDLDKLPF